MIVIKYLKTKFFFQVLLGHHIVFYGLRLRFKFTAASSFRQKIEPIFQGVTIYSLVKKFVE